jgi:hypothetical protein
MTASALLEVIRAAIEPVLSAHGFEWAGDSKWVRSDRAPIRHVVEARAGRHGMRVMQWGVSLDYVPHLVGSAVRWHRTAKAARLDLGYDPNNFRDPWDFHAQEWTISPDLGWPTPAERASQIARLLDETALPWVDAVTDSSSLLAAFDREQGREGGQFGFDDYIQYRLAYAFALARIGQLDRAVVEFARWSSRVQPPADAQRQLFELLRAAVAD